MKSAVHDDKHTMGRAAAQEGAAAIRQAIAPDGRAAIIVATGASQFEMLEHLVQEGIDWSRSPIQNHPRIFTPLRDGG